MYITTVFITEQSKTTPQWNFYKYLINANGQVIGAWGPRVGVDHMRQYIDNAVREAKLIQSREELWMDHAGWHSVTV